MLTQSVIDYVAAVYGVLVGLLLPLIILHGRLYFIKSSFGFRTLLAYLGRLVIIFLLFSVLVGAVLSAVELLSASGSIDKMIESGWYLAGFFSGFVSGIVLYIIGMRRARKQPRAVEPREVQES